MHLEEAVSRFILAKRADGRKQRTIKDYYRCLGPFQAWCDDKNLKLNNITRQRFRHYVAKEIRCPERDLAAGTVAIHLSVLRCFFNWLQEENLLDRDVAGAVEMPSKKERRRVERPLTPDEIEKLLHACQGDPQSERDRAMILTFLDTGLRRIELTRLKRYQLNITEEGDGWFELIDPKSLEIKYAVLSKTTVKTLEAYLRMRDDDCPNLWIGRRGPLTVHGVSKAIQKRGKQSGVTRVHPHLFRKTFATEWVKAGGSEQYLMKLGGWSSPDMLQIYVNSGNLPDLLEAHREKSPVSNLIS